ncbi:hypothetical protein AB1K84_22460 [Mesobacillus foraminis]|uniref:hypothetical protein n=1 Tax=Mesobacillus foraminis TaxID=279826 RepID=UPI0039A192A6
MSVFGILGCLSLICALLIVKDKKKYRWLIKPVGLKDNARFASSYYSIMGLLLVSGSVISDNYISGFIIPVLAIIFSIIMSGMIIVKKMNKEKIIS